MKILLIGGPKNGTTLHLKAGVAVLTEHEGIRYEYRREYFSWIGGGIDAIWPVFVHGELTFDFDVLSMILREEIEQVGRASDLPPEQQPRRAR